MRRIFAFLHVLSHLLSPVRINYQQFKMTRLLRVAGRGCSDRYRPGQNGEALLQMSLKAVLRVQRVRLIFLDRPFPSVE